MAMNYRTEKTRTVTKINHWPYSKGDRLCSNYLNLEWSLNIVDWSILDTHLNWLLDGWSLNREISCELNALRDFAFQLCGSSDNQLLFVIV